MSHLSVEVNYGNLLLEHLTVQLHLFQETDVQLPERQETGIRKLFRKNNTFLLTSRVKLLKFATFDINFRVFWDLNLIMPFVREEVKYLCECGEVLLATHEEEESTYFFLWSLESLALSLRARRLSFLSFSLIFSSSSLCSSSLQPSASMFVSLSMLFSSEQNATRSWWSSWIFRIKKKDYSHCSN